MVGINGPRWMLRCSLLGAAAAQPDDAKDWEESIRKVAVHRGAHAMPVGEGLPVVMPPQARKSVTKKKLRRTISRWANPANRTRPPPQGVLARR